MLNLSVELSDELIEVLGNSIYNNRNFNLQSELRKEYQKVEQRLQNLDKRLSFLEKHAAGAEAVGRGFNYLNDKMEGINSDVYSYKRQQMEIAKQMEQIERTVEQIYVAFNEGISKTIHDEVANAVKNIPAPDSSKTIHDEIVDIFEKIAPSIFSKIIHDEVADAVKLEIQRLKTSTAIPSAPYYVIAKKQSQTIETQQKTIEELQALVKDLTERLSAIEKKSADATVEAKSEIPLNIRDKNSWAEYKNRLQDIGKLEQFAENNADDFRVFVSKLTRIKRAIAKIKPEEFNEYTTATIVDATIDMAKNFIDVLENCDRTIKNPKKDSTAAKELCNLIEEYLSRLGIHPMDFKVGGDYVEWADLGMSETPIIESTNDIRKHDTLKEITVQPHFIHYIDEHDKKVRRVFGGQCVAYAYKA